MQDMRYNIRVYLQPAFLICAVVLAIAGSAMPIAIRKFGIYLEKKPLPLKKSLDLLDEKRLAPYTVETKQKIENDEIVKELGTEDYIQWSLEDPEAAVDSTVRKCLLFITYYELPDRVPHVPEECYVGGGHQRLDADNLVFKVDRDRKEQKVPGRWMLFGTKDADYWAAGTKFTVLYLFRVNGEYKGNRESARLALNKNIRGEYSYFSKVEWKFFNTRFGTVVYPEKDEAIAASEKLLGTILPVLEADHWPDWEELSSSNQKENIKNKLSMK